MENSIQLENKNIFRLNIKNAEGKDTGKYLTFNLDDIELPLKMNKADIIHKQNVNRVRTQIMALDKKEDRKGKYLLSWKEEETIKILNNFYKDEMNAFDTIFGKGACKDVLAGQDPYFEMFDDIVEALKPYTEKLSKMSFDMTEKIKNKYKGIIENVDEANES